MSMKTAMPLIPPIADASLVSVSDTSRISAFVSLTKPRIAIMVLMTVAVGYVLGARGSAHPLGLALSLLGTGLVAGGSSVWNQILERDRDAMMKRTSRRALPTGQVTLGEAMIFGSLLGIAGLVILFVGANPLSAAVAFLTFVLYVAVYTPLKPITTLNTAIGAIPGALPPVIGWAAATGTLGIEAFSLFLIVFLWQFPHFLAIAWVHRDDYARGGHKMLPNVDPDGIMTARQAVVHALVLVPAGLLPTVIGVAGGWYFFGSLLLGLLYLAASVRFWLDVNDATARRLMRVSFIYLPVILFLLLMNPMPS